jgi:thioredoxin-like negative regulator of GroEL
MSTGLFFLTDDNFNIQSDPNGKKLCVNIEGYSLVFFYSTNCTHCQQLIPMYKKLPNAVGGCTFAMVNINASSGVVAKSKATQAPIKYVPLIVLYIAGKPFMRYDGPHKFEEIKRFVIEIATKMSKKPKGQSNRQQARGQNVQAAQKAQVNVPAYTIGMPKNSGPRNATQYIKFDNAYTGK